MDWFVYKLQKKKKKVELIIRQIMLIGSETETTKYFKHKKLENINKK